MVLPNLQGQAGRHHGEMMGDHGMIAKGMPHYDTGIRCPLIVTGGVVRQGVSDRLCCSIDLFPTFCMWGGVPEESIPPCEGKSFASSCTVFQDGTVDAQEGWQEVAVSIGDVDSVITNDGWRLTRFSSQDAGQMFNLKEDPQEQHNLYHDPQYQNKKIELLERLVKTRTQPRIVPQYRNLASRDGQRWLTNDGVSWPEYPTRPSPWLMDDPKPEWQGRVQEA